MQLTQTFFYILFLTQVKRKEKKKKPWSVLKVPGNVSGSDAHVC